ncbi:hypothetical protein GF327_06210 [Candidatus Woesearchaeota archaeon]|nr:hypothetical protein [Candidatus Woesearchaeota archaeon]
MKNNKKASLNLSINAIVVLILAITMLGLGLGFMRNMFTNVQENFEDVSDQVQKDMIKRLKDSGERVVLSKYEVKMKQSTEEVIHIAINEESAPAGGYSNFQLSLSGTSKVGASGVTCMDNDQISLIQGEQRIESGEAKVFPIYLKSDSRDQGTCQYTLIVSYESFDSAATSQGSGSYATDDFYVTVS